MCVCHKVLRETFNFDQILKKQQQKTSWCRPKINTWVRTHLCILYVYVCHVCMYVCMYVCCMHWSTHTNTNHKITTGGGLFATPQEENKINFFIYLRYLYLPGYVHTYAYCTCMYVCMYVCHVCCMHWSTHTNTNHKITTGGGLFATPQEENKINFFIYLRYLYFSNT